MQFLFVDQILELQPGKSIQGIKHITEHDYYLYENNDKCAFIPSFIGETLGQLAAWNVMHTNGFTKRPVAGIVASAQIFRNAYVGETLFLESTIERLDEEAVLYNSQAKIDEEIVFSVQGALGPLLPMNDFITQDEVIKQFDRLQTPQISKKSSNKLIKRPVLPLRFDNIIEQIPGQSLIAEKLIMASEPWFADHFPLKPVLPMTVLLECQINLAETFIAVAGFKEPFILKELRKMKMNDFVEPGSKIICQVKVKEQTADTLVLQFRNEVEGKRVCVLEMFFTQ